MLSFNLSSKSDQPVIRVLIVDDMPQVRRDLRLLLQLSSELEVVGEATNGQEAILQAEILHPDVVIMDIKMPIMDGLQATRQIKKHKLAKRILILSIYSDAEEVHRAIEAGADVFIAKGTPYSTLMKFILPNMP
jgi:NarL family two-component system response regulator LiaR